MGTKAKTMHNGQSRDVRLRVYSIFLVLGTGKDGTVWRRHGVMIAETAVSDNDIGCDCGLRLKAAWVWPFYLFGPLLSPRRYQCDTD